MITLRAADRERLESVVHKLPASQRDVQRARIVLAAGDGIDNVVIAEQVTADVNTVSKWRKRFFEEGVEGLSDRHRSGRPVSPASRRRPPHGCVPLSLNRGLGEDTDAWADDIWLIDSTPSRHEERGGR